jgi:hypothetical protein
VDANNEKLMQDYYSLRGVTPTPTNKPNNANNPPKIPVNKSNYRNNSVDSKAHYTDKENELLAQNRRQQEEIEQLKQALAVQTAPPQHANTSDHTNSADSDKAAKISAMKAKLAELKPLMEKETAELGLEKPKSLAKRLPAAKAKAKELLAKIEAEKEAKELATLRIRAKELKAKLEKIDFNSTKKKKP